jgi:hypothetical protein
MIFESGAKISEQLLVTKLGFDGLRRRIASLTSVLKSKKLLKNHRKYSVVSNSNKREERKHSSVLWRRVDIVLTDVSEERIASIFRVQEKRRKSASEEPA